MPKRTVDLFTPEEHRVISEWLGVEPPTGTPGLENALAALCFVEADWGPPEVAWAVAHIVLESVEQALPQWEGWQDGEVVYGRTYRPQEAIPTRLTKLQPQFLFEINWATSAPGVDWPVAYWVTWVPEYERYVVTVSADSVESLGGTNDTALAHFGAEVDLHEGCREIITKAWSGRQHRWECVIKVGLVNRYAAEGWADEIWGTPEEYQDGIPRGGIEGAILRDHPGLTEEDLEEEMRGY